MHCRAVARPAVWRCTQSVSRAVLRQQRPNSFMKHVMEQVKKDMEADPKMKQDWEKVEESSRRMVQSGATLEERLNRLGDNLRNASVKTSARLSVWKASTQGILHRASSHMDDATTSSESMRRARDFLNARVEASKNIFASTIDSSSRIVDFVSDADKRGEKTKKWRDGRAAVAAMAEEAAARSSAAGMEASTDAAKEGSRPALESESALVVSEARNSTWDRFTARVQDMPFLSSVFENPVLDRLFGESELAASIREMKDVDYSFQLEELEEDMESIVAPHIIQTFLEGDQQALEKHCGEAAFAAVNASIKARQQQRMSLDSAVLAGPKDLQLVTAKLNEMGPPSFIWTFTMQQVNCLRDHKGEIIEGAVDDIRDVGYAVAVNRHPRIDTPELALEYPWQVSELAILWNKPCF